MAEDLLKPPSLDNTPVWFEVQDKEGNWNKRVFPKHAVAKMLADKNRGWRECEADFVPKKQIRPFDEGKTTSGMKNANTEMTGRQVDEFLNQTVAELKDFCKANEISLTGCTTKKAILEAIEKAGKLK